MPVIQRIVPRSTVASEPAAPGEPPKPVLSIEQGIRARTKDPLWFLARQWQMAEFEASNGGAIRNAEVTYSTRVVDRFSAPGAPSRVADRRLPWEAIVGSGNATTDGLLDRARSAKRPGWSSRQLRYDFGLKAGKCLATVELEATGYRGDHLDWYRFIMKRGWSAGETKRAEVFPQAVKFRGLPGCRWWEFEDEKTELADASPTGPNILTLLLLEFGLVYSNDWFVIPLRQNVGSVRRVTGFQVVDSFGKKTEIGPSRSHAGATNRFRMFQLRHDGWLGWNRRASSEYLLLPNVITKHARSGPLEEVVFRRDDVSNLVWAIEKRKLSLTSALEGSGLPEIRTQNLEGALSSRQELVLVVRPGGAPPTSQRLAYRAAPVMPRNWVPYVAVPDRERWPVRAIHKLTTVLAKVAERLKKTDQPTGDPATPGATPGAGEVFDAVERGFQAMGTSSLRRGRTHSDVDVDFELIEQYRTQILARSRSLAMGSVPSVPISVSDCIEAVPYGSETWKYRELDGKRYEAYRADSGRKRFIWIGRSTRAYTTSADAVQIDFDELEPGR
jgi:hypothetical protein